MKPSEIKVAELKDYSACMEAVQQIEKDYRNVVGGMKAWCSGWNTELTQSAKNKIKAIEKRMDTFVDDCEDE